MAFLGHVAGWPQNPESEDWDLNLIGLFRNERGLKRFPGLTDYGSAPLWHVVARDSLSLLGVPVSLLAVSVSHDGAHESPFGDGVCAAAVRANRQETSALRPSCREARQMRSK